jgi:hypothetical protein
MKTRRDFFQSLAAAPLALLGVKLAPQLFQLPVGCDLSMTSLQWAINEGTRLRFGKPHTLIIGPENLFPARELLGRPPFHVNEIFKREEFLIYEVTRDMPMNCWRVQFEHGVVESQGP